ncbi:MAG: RNA polymerase sigma factor [Chloroflexota bacterium]
MGTGDPLPDEACVVERAQRGDSLAFETIYHRYQQRIAGYLYRMVQDGEVASDLTQDVFLRAYRAIGQTGPGLNLKAWLFTIATNAALSHHRHKRLIQWLPLDPVDDVGTESGLAERVADRAELSAALKTLPRDQAACFLLWARQGFTYEEIGVMLGVSPGTAKTRSYRARLALARALRAGEENG